MPPHLLRRRPTVAALGLLLALAVTATARADAPVAQLQSFLATDGATVAAAADQPFANKPLSKAGARQAGELLWNHHAQTIRRERAAEIRDKVIELEGAAMPFDFRVYGEAPATGRSLYLSLHGGGGAPARVNDQQWRNQVRLYQPEEGIYVAPRAPSNTWDLWSREPVGRMLDRLIEAMVVIKNVNPDRVYLMGYSAGGDGVYQLAPRMADRWAAAAMMAGHPNDASPLGLRNIGFALQVGGRDAAYRRNDVAKEWGERLAALQQADPAGYKHLVKIYPNKGHWMDGEDRLAVPWMARFTRNPTPDRVVWRQAGITLPAFYWLAVDQDQRRKGATITATRQGSRFTATLEGVERARLLLRDDMTDLDQSVTIARHGPEGEAPPYKAAPKRTIATLARTLAQRGDRRLMFSAEVVIKL